MTRRLIVPVVLVAALAAAAVAVLVASSGSSTPVATTAAPAPTANAGLRDAVVLHPTVARLPQARAQVPDPAVLPQRASVSGAGGESGTGLGAQQGTYQPPVLHGSGAIPSGPGSAGVPTGTSGLTAPLNPVLATILGEGIQGGAQVGAILSGLGLNPPPALP